MSERCGVVPSSDGRGRRTGAGVWVALVLCALAGSTGMGAPVASAADSCPNAVIRAQRSQERLPNCRAYELVSPLDKAGADVAVTPFGAGYAGYSGASADGNRLVFSTPSVSVGDAVRGIQFLATATRTAEGWKTVSTIPGPPPSVVGDFVAHVPHQEFLSDDATAVQFYATFPYVDSPLLPAAPGADSLYIAHTLSGSIDWLNRPVAADAAPMPGSYTSNTIGTPAGGSPDFRTSYFSFCGTLVAEDAPRVGQSANFGFYVARDGVVHSAGTLPDGSLDPLGAVPAGDPRLGCRSDSTFGLEDQAARGNQVSRDGSRAFFLSPNVYAANGAPNVRPPQLYVHREGKSSLLISRSLSDPATPTPAGVSMVNGDSYVMATPDGRYVVFGSTDRLTADAPSGSTVPLQYRFDVETEHLTYLPGLDGRLVAISEDGGRILTGRSGPSGNELSLYDRGTVHVIDDSPAVNSGTGIASPHVSADGSTWVFSSTKPLRGATTDPLPPPSNQELASEVYRYVVGDDDATCISCPAPGAPSSLGASVDAFGPHDFGETVGVGPPGRPSRNVSPDGKRVFFYTPNALLPEDVNTKGDVYMWEDGALSLISTGKSARNTYLLDSSVSGDDVFIATVEELFPGDVDDAYDVYDVRVGGGQAALGKEESCSGDNCQGALTVPQGAAAPASAAFQGLGNPPVIEVPAGGSGKPKVAKVKTVRGTLTRLSVKVPGKGVIRISGSGLKAGSKAVSKAGTYAVTVGLSERAQRTLARKHRVKVQISVRFVPASGKAASVSVAATFTSKPAARGRTSVARRATVLLSDARKSR